MTAPHSAPASRQHGIPTLSLFVGSGRVGSRPRMLRLLLLVICVGCIINLPNRVLAKHVLVVVGPSNHPPETHEVAAGGQLMAHCIETAKHDVSVRATVTDQWPQDPALLAEIDSVVFIGDQFPPHQMPNSAKIMADLQQLMDRGCGLVCIHFATGLRNPDVPADGQHPLLDWLGGYFASRCEHHQSTARIFPAAEIQPVANDHPVTRGWKKFTIHDEPYIDNYFGPDNAMLKDRTVALATSMLPPESPAEQIVSWGIERPEGGRGFAVVMPHYYRNWQHDDLRKLIMNGIFWTSQVEIPSDGIETSLNDFRRTPPPSPAWPAVGHVDQALHDYFVDQVEQIKQHSDLTRFTSWDQWQATQTENREALADMLSLRPEPTRSDLQATIVGQVQRDGVIVERLHYQALPGLYVAANLYRPSEQEKPLPAVLYVCGHSNQQETINGRKVVYGNKTGYQRHGEWLARHGYVCLMIDTIQWGEFLGQHWGTYRDNRWDWLSLGYTPAGVETWNGIRGLDYLETRPEVDAEKIAVTGRSGGGAYSWFIAALDQRVKVAIPVAGITDLENYVIDGCVSGHCDCMFMVNYHRWDYPQLAAMIAPRPLLLANSDRDSIFPLSGVARTLQQVQHVYQLAGAEENLGSWITPGIHKDTYELQVGAFRWLDLHLKDLDRPIAEPPMERFERAELKVFAELPEDQRVTTADQVFREHLERFQQPAELTGAAGRQRVIEQLRERSFAGWPSPMSELNPVRIWQNGAKIAPAELWEFSSQPHVRLRAIVQLPPTWATKKSTTPFQLHIADEKAWQQLSRQAIDHLLEPVDRLRVTIIPRGLGPNRWSGTPTEQIHIRRRFNLLGQTVAGMQAYDITQAVRFMNTLADEQPFTIAADPSLATVTIYAAAVADEPWQLVDVRLADDYLTEFPLLGAANIAGLDALLRTLEH